MGWHLPTMGNRMIAFCHPWEIFAIFYCCFMFVDKERSKILVQLNLGLCDILEVHLLTTMNKTSNSI